MKDHGLSTNEEAAPQGGKSLVAFLAKYGTAAWVLFLLASCVPALFVRTEFNAPFVWSFKYLSAPVVVTCLWVGLRNREDFQERSRTRVASWIALIFIPLLIVMMGGGAATALNMAIPPQTHFMLKGTVTDKFISSGRRSSTWVVVVTGGAGVRKLEVSSREYDALGLGMPFAQERIMGPLGFSYTWKR
ncbi:MAG TPA: hypothetical protein VIJ19_07270 [Opitutaceae bacterium]